MRVKDIAEVYTGNSIAESIKRAKYTNLTEGYNYIGTKDVGFDNVIDYENGVKIPRSEPKFRYAFPNDILLCIEGGSAGRKIGILREQVCFGNKLCNFHQYFNSSSYMYYFLQTPSFVSIFQENMTGIIGGVSRDKIQNILFPLPPLEEQKRIVSKIVSLEPFIDDYDQAETELSALNNSFPEQIKKSILQYAIQGKLVPQDPKDEPASVLLENIKTEKQKLIKAGKIKKDKVESYIYKRDNRHYEKIGNKEVDITDEIPFEIPDSWAWVRLGDIALINPKNECKDTLLASFIPMNLLEGGYCNNYQYECRSWEEIKKGFTHFAQEDIVVAKITPCFQNRKSAILYKLQGELGAGTTELHVVRCVHPLTPEYIFWTFKTEHFITQGIKNFTGTAGQQRISSSFIKNYLIPLPPQKEQQRIVTRIGQLFKTLS